MRRFIALPFAVALTILSLSPLPASADEASSFGQIRIAAGKGLFGRKAGPFEAYPNSDAMKGAGFVWTADALKAWMADNDGFIPGTRMRHVGIEDATVQDFILEYLKSISG
jgi:hypothetical protein